MRIYTVSIVAIVLLLSCKGQSDKSSRSKYFDQKVLVDSQNIPQDSNQFYFPLELFRDSSRFIEYDTFVVKWYSSQLFAMKEPLFFNEKSKKEMYRFTWLRTFHHPVAIRIEKDSDMYTIYWKICSGAGGYEPGRLIASGKKAITNNDWYKFQLLLFSIHYWELSTNGKDIGGNDGSQWILEGATPYKYHVVDRWTPDKNDDYYKTCDFLIGLTNFDFKPKEKY
jgi:hypothetical protein